MNGIGSKHNSASKQGILTFFNKCVKAFKFTRHAASCFLSEVLSLENNVGLCGEFGSISSGSILRLSRHAELDSASIHCTTPERSRNEFGMTQGALAFGLLRRFLKKASRNDAKVFSISQNIYPLAITHKIGLSIYLLQFTIASPFTLPSASL